MLGAGGGRGSLSSASGSTLIAVFIRFPLTARPTVDAVAVLGLRTGALAFLISLSCRRPKEFAIEDILFDDVTLGGRDVCDLVVLLTGSICAGATCPDIVLLDGGPGGGGSFSGSSEAVFNLVLTLVDVDFILD